MRAWIARIALLVFSFTFMLGFCEIVVRVALPQDLGIWRTTRDGMITLRPGIDTVLPSFGHRVRTNSLGFRDHEHAADPPAGTHRILVLGDSFMEALQVDVEDAFARLLAGRLSDEDRRVEVVNAGVSGWGTADQAIWLRRGGADLAIDRIVVVMTLHNDVSDNLELRHHEPGPTGLRPRPVAEIPLGSWIALEAKGWLAGHSHLYRLVTQRMRGGEVAAAGIALNQHVVDLFRVEEPPDIVRGWALTEAHLDEIAAEARLRGAGMTVVLVPLAIQLDPDAFAGLVRRAGLSVDDVDPTRPQARATACAERVGAEVVDLLPAMREAARGASETLYLPRDGHWNEAGHASAAAIVAESMGIP